MNIIGDLKVVIAGVELRLMPCPSCQGKGWIQHYQHRKGSNRGPACTVCAGQGTLAILPYPVVFDLLQKKKTEEEKKKSGIQA